MALLLELHRAHVHDLFAHPGIEKVLVNITREILQRNFK